MNSLTVESALSEQMKRVQESHWQTGVVYLIVVEGVDLIRILNIWAGDADPVRAKETQPGSFRAQYGIDQIHNGIFVPNSYSQGMPNFYMVYRFIC